MSITTLQEIIDSKARKDVTEEVEKAFPKVVNYWRINNLYIKRADIPQHCESIRADRLIDLVKKELIEKLLPGRIYKDSQIIMDKINKQTGLNK